MIADRTLMTDTPRGAHRWSGRDGYTAVGTARASSSCAAKVAAIVQAVYDSGDLSLTEVGRRTGLSRSTAHRLLIQLVGAQLLERTVDGRYCARGTPRQSIARTRPAAAIRAAVCQVLDDLGVATGLRGRFGVLRGSQISYLERPPDTWPRSCEAGLTPLPLHATALGKTLLAHAPEALRRQVVKGGLVSYTGLTITTAQQLEWSLAAARRAQIIVTWGEFANGIGAVAAPVRDPQGVMVAAVELTIGDLDRDLPRVRPSLLIAARALGRTLATWSTALPASTGNTAMNWRSDPTSPSLIWQNHELPDEPRQSWPGSNNSHSTIP
jgi:DNA-binding IclR family transcriptional regulator